MRPVQGGCKNGINICVCTCAFAWLHVLKCRFVEELCNYRATVGWELILMRKRCLRVSDAQSFHAAFRGSTFKCCQSTLKQSHIQYYLIKLNHRNLCKECLTSHEMGGADLYCKSLRNQKTFESLWECASYFKVKSNIFFLNLPKKFLMQTNDHKSVAI